MQGLLIINVFLALAISLVGWRIVHQLNRKKLVSTLWWCSQGVFLLAGFALILLVFSNLHTYQRFTYESVISDVYIRQLAPQRFQVSLSHPNGEDEPSYFVLEGDQWRLETRILKWNGFATLIGLNSFYQFDRLSGRYQDAAQARTRLPSIHDLLSTSRGLDIWKLKHSLGDKIGLVDAIFGQGVFMPMKDGAHFQVSIGQSGLITRAVNDAAGVSGF